MKIYAVIFMGAITIASPVFSQDFGAVISETLESCKNWSKDKLYPELNSNWAIINKAEKRGEFAGIFVNTRFAIKLITRTHEGQDQSGTTINIKGCRLSPIDTSRNVVHHRLRRYPIGDTLVNAEEIPIEAARSFISLIIEDFTQNPNLVPIFQDERLKEGRENNRHFVVCSNKSSTTFSLLPDGVLGRGYTSGKQTWDAEFFFASRAPEAEVLIECPSS